MTDYRVRVIVLTDHNASVAAVHLFDEQGGEAGYATGSAKREPGDVYDEQIATSLAAGRALEKLGRLLRRTAEDQVIAAAKVQGRERDRAAFRRLRRDSGDRAGLLSIAEIREKHGEEAAQRAEARRTTVQGWLANRLKENP